MIIFFEQLCFYSLPQDKIRERAIRAGDYNPNQTTRKSEGSGAEIKTETIEIKDSGPKKPLQKQPTLDSLPPPPDVDDTVDKPRRMSKV